VERNQRLAPARLELRGQQIASMHDDVREAVVGGKCIAEIEAGKRQTGYRVHHHEAFGKCRELENVLEHTETIEHAGRVWRQLKAGADLGELRRFLDDMHTASAACGGERRRQSSNSAADDEERSVHPRRSYDSAPCFTTIST
jgi:hypothetical protein